MGRPKKENEISDEAIIHGYIAVEGAFGKLTELLHISRTALAYRLKKNPNIKARGNAILHQNDIWYMENNIKQAQKGSEKAQKSGFDLASSRLNLVKEKPKKLDLTITNQGPRIKINRIPVFPGQPIPEIEQIDDEINLLIPLPLIGMWHPKRFFITYSGRGAGKSWSIAQELLARAMEKKIRVGCFREVQLSIRDSVHKLLADQIERLNISKYFKVTKDSIVCTLTGSDFIFRGLKDLTAEAIKSIEGIDIAWIEEAQTISENSWQILTPGIRKPNSEIWCSMNPRFKSDVIYKRFIAEDAVLPPKTIVAKTNWRDNPWFPEVLKGEMEVEKKMSEAYYNHIWEGGLKTIIGEMIKRGWWHYWDPAKKYDYILKIISADTAFSEESNADYSVMQVWAMTRDLRNLDLIDSIRGQWSYPNLLKNIKGLIEKHTQNDTVPLGPTLIEKKASGQSLIQSLREEGILVLPFEPGTTNKVMRVYAIQQKIFDGSIRIPPPSHAAWVNSFLDEVSSFSDDMSHDLDDQVDTMTQAILTWIEQKGEG